MLVGNRGSTTEDEWSSDEDYFERRKSRSMRHARARLQPVNPHKGHRHEQWLVLTVVGL